MGVLENENEAQSHNHIHKPNIYFTYIVMPRKIYTYWMDSDHSTRHACHHLLIIPIRHEQKMLSSESVRLIEIDAGVLMLNKGI